MAGPNEKMGTIEKSGTEYFDPCFQQLSPSPDGAGKLASPGVSKGYTLCWRLDGLPASDELGLAGGVPNGTLQFGARSP